MQPTRDSDPEGWGTKATPPAGSRDGTDTTAPERVEEGIVSSPGGHGEGIGWLRWALGRLEEN